MTYEDESLLLTDPEVLTETHVPPDILRRTEQIKELLGALRPAAQRTKPVHCWVYGNPGTGKTATTKWVLRRLAEEAGVRGMYVNCWEYPTYFSVLDRLVRELRVLGAERLTVSFKLERLQRYLGTQPVILVLDEIDQPAPKERYSILYNLCQLGNLGLVCVCNSPHVYFELEDRVKSRLNPTAVYFPHYSADDLLAILERRSEYALAAGACSQEVLSSIAELANGDARVAIQTLRNATLLADRERAGRIRPSHIHAGWNSAKDLKKAQRLRKLTDHHRLLYELIAQRPAILSGDLWRLYLRTCKDRGLKPIAVRTYSDYCNELVDLDLIQAKRAAIQGKVREFSVLR